MNKSSILVIDDEPQIRKLLEITLENEGYHSLLAEDARNGLALAASHSPYLIILDIELPDKHGLTVLKELRTWYRNAIIMLSVIHAEETVVKALDSGADDYLSKPFRTAELVARVRNAIKRLQHRPSEPCIQCDDLVIDFTTHQVTKRGATIKLTATEFKLMSCFMRHIGKVLTHPYLMREIWGNNGQTEAQYLRVFIGKLRKKIEDNPSHPKHIITENGIGYRFN